MPCSGFNAGGIEFDAVESGDFCDLVRATGNYDTEIRESCEVQCGDNVTSPLTMEVVESRKSLDFSSSPSSSSPEEEMEEDEEEEEDEESDELFFQPPPRRISMLWNSKLKWKEERKKVLKISVAKLRKIEDPELSLCRAILINNTVKRLHRDIRDDKMARYPPDLIRPTPYHHHPLLLPPEPFPPRKRSYDYVTGSGGGDDYCNDKENLTDYHHQAETPTSPTATEAPPTTTPSNNAKRARLANATTLFSNDLTSVALMDEYRNELRTACQQHNAFNGDAHETRSTVALKGHGEVVTQQRNHLASLECCAKDEMNAFNRYSTTTSVTTTTITTTTSSAMNNITTTSAATAVTSCSSTAATTTQKADKMASEYEKQYSQYSCGQFSIFGELQSVVFHSLITSLES